MIARLRSLAERPITPAQRPRAMAAAVAIALVASAALVATKPATDRAAEDSRAPALAAKPQAPVPGAPTRSGAPEAPVPAAARRAARRFLTGYLPYLYARRRSPGSIPAASAALKRRLARQRPRPSPALRRLRPRVTRLDTRRARHQVIARALIDDGGVARYAIGLLVTRRAGAWRVTSVAGH